MQKTDVADSSRLRLAVNLADRQLMLVQHQFSQEIPDEATSLSYDTTENAAKGRNKNRSIAHKSKNVGSVSYELLQNWKTR
jgi:hypothetical protein